MSAFNSTTTNSRPRKRVSATSAPKGIPTTAATSTAFTLTLMTAAQSQTGWVTRQDEVKGDVLSDDKRDFQATMTLKHATAFS